MFGMKRGSGALFLWSPSVDDKGILKPHRSFEWTEDKRTLKKVVFQISLTADLLQFLHHVRRLQYHWGSSKWSTTLMYFRWRIIHVYYRGKKENAEISLLQFYKLIHNQGSTTKKDMEMRVESNPFDFACKCVCVCLCTSVWAWSTSSTVREWLSGSFRRLMKL